MENDERTDEDKNLVDRLNTYIQELSLLCDGMGVQHFEAANYEDGHGEGDTMTSLDKMAGECEALLACLEVGIIESDGQRDKEIGKSGDERLCNEEKQQMHQHGKLNKSFCLKAGLAHELESFADELNDFLLGLNEGHTSADIFSVFHLLREKNEDTYINKGENHYVNDDVTAGSLTLDTDVERMDGTNILCKQDAFSERAKKAVAVHIKRQKHWHYQTKIQSSLQNEQADQDQASAVKVRFQSLSYNHHIMRQKLARRRAKQSQDALHLVETSRLKGSKPFVYCYLKRDAGTSIKHSAHDATYSNQYKSSSVHSSVCAYEPQYLCTVYLYGLHRLGVIFISFNSIVQLEQRVREKFAVNKVASVYREVTKVKVSNPTLGYHNNRKRHIKRLQRVTTLEQLYDGDTLCVTQNAYDDMHILCGQIKQSQRVVHNFQYNAHHPSNEVWSTISEKRIIKLAQKRYTNMSQLWDFNGRSIDVKRQQHSVP